MISDIRKAAERLVEQPDMAFREPLLKERSKVFRSLIVRKIYKIVYYNENNTVYIADIWDSRQDPNSLRDRHSSA
ncbi:hypothetical protein AGMMS49525_05060 [Bacteroidia bacterium]|nr:hypothetical protein AGMMS49525_05060 [Bacteroidia bacterium]